MANEVTITQATEKDIPVIQELAEAIWPKTYDPILREGQTRYMLDRMYNIDSLLTQITKDGHIFYLIKINRIACGFASFGLVESDTKTYKLHKLYVQTILQNKGLGRLLIEHIEQSVRQLSGERLILNVNRKNTALAFYQKCGYSIYQSVDLPYGPYWINDYIMEKLL